MYFRRVRRNVFGKASLITEYVANAYSSAVFFFTHHFTLVGTGLVVEGNRTAFSVLDNTIVFSQRFAVGGFARLLEFAVLKGSANSSLIISGNSIEIVTHSLINHTLYALTFRESDIANTKIIIDLNAFSSVFARRNNTHETIIFISNAMQLRESSHIFVLSNTIDSASFPAPDIKFLNSNCYLPNIFQQFLSLRLPTTHALSLFSSAGGGGGVSALSQNDRFVGIVLQQMTMSAAATATISSNVIAVSLHSLYYHLVNVTGIEIDGKIPVIGNTIFVTTNDSVVRLRAFGDGGGVDGGVRQTVDSRVVGQSVQREMRQAIGGGGAGSVDPTRFKWPESRLSERTLGSIRALFGISFVMDKSQQIQLNRISFSIHSERGSAIAVCHIHSLSPSSDSNFVFGAVLISDNVLDMAFLGSYRDEDEDVVSSADKAFFNPATDALLLDPTFGQPGVLLDPLLDFRFRRHFIFIWKVFHFSSLSISSNAMSLSFEDAKGTADTLSWWHGSQSPRPSSGEKVFTSAHPIVMTRRHIANDPRPANSYSAFSNRAGMSIYSGIVIFDYYGFDSSGRQTIESNTFDVFIGDVLGGAGGDATRALGGGGGGLPSSPFYHFSIRKGSGDGFAEFTSARQHPASNALVNVADHLYWARNVYDGEEKDRNSGGPNATPFPISESKAWRSLQYHRIIMLYLHGLINLGAHCVISHNYMSSASFVGGFTSEGGGGAAQLLVKGDAVRSDLSDAGAFLNGPDYSLAAALLLTSPSFLVCEGLSLSKSSIMQILNNTQEGVGGVAMLPATHDNVTSTHFISAAVNLKVAMAIFAAGSSREGELARRKVLAAFLTSFAGTDILRASGAYYTTENFTSGASFEPLHCMGIDAMETLLGPNHFKDRFISNLSPSFVRGVLKGWLTPASMLFPSTELNGGSIRIYNYYFVAAVNFTASRENSVGGPFLSASVRPSPYPFSQRLSQLSVVILPLIHYSSILSFTGGDVSSGDPFLTTNGGIIMFIDGSVVGEGLGDSVFNRFPRGVNRYGEAKSDQEAEGGIPPPSANDAVQPMTPILHLVDTFDDFMAAHLFSTLSPTDASSPTVLSRAF